MRRIAVIIVGTVSGVLLAPGVASAAPGGAATTCSGTLASGHYHRLVVPAGAVCDGTGATIHVRGGVRVGEGATFALGGEDSTDTGTIAGGVRATNAASVQIHFAAIKGGLRIRGGSGPFGAADVNFNAIEDNHIKGGATVTGYDGFWFGFIRNHVNGSVRLNNNVLVDEDGNEYVTNTIKGSLICHNNSPAPHVGDSEGEPNVVTGQKVDQCAGL